MGESLDLFSYTLEHMQLPEKDMSLYAPLTLAYIGDAVYELVIRTKVVMESTAQVNTLHKHTTTYVKAEAQARIIKLIQNDLDEEETAVYKRGRNAKSYSTAKNASITDYRQATGFEALMGYLYLSGKSDRMIELIRLGISRIGESI